MSDLPGGHLFPHLDHKTRGHDNVSDWLDFRENPRWTEDSTPAAPNPNLIGSVFSRHFRGHGFFWGLVDSFLGKTEKGEEIYRVKYQDGETEDLHAHKIRSFMKETEDRGRASEAPSRDSFDPSESKGITSLEFDLKVNDSVPNSKFRKKYPIANDIMSSKEPPAVLDDLLPGASGFPSAGRDSFVVKPPQFYVDCGQEGKVRLLENGPRGAGTALQQIIRNLEEEDSFVPDPAGKWAFLPRSRTRRLNVQAELLGEAVYIIPMYS
uniref:PTM/DIR17-like Tudor domain-containing protein n=1 Tax=Lotharella globosa TaxID=91324 RepID=A0A7S4E0L8_9EUKA